MKTGGPAVGRALIRLDAWAARRPAAVRVAEKVRHHCDLVIAGALTGGRDPDPRTNGEFELCRCVGSRARRFVDVGAADGKWGRELLRHAPADASGLLYEPSPTCAARLRDEFGGDRVEVVEAALSDRSSGEPSVLYEEVGQPTNASLIPAFRSAVSHQVRLASLADELDVRGWDRVDVVKIDAEGHELRVIRGAAPFLERRAIDVLQFKYSGMWSRVQDSLGEALNVLEGHGYTVMLLNRSGLRAYDYPRWRETFAYTNFVAVHEDSAGFVRELVVGS